jgi:hypothetical protein
MSANLTVMGYRKAGLRHTNRIVLAILVALVGLSDPVLSTNIGLHALSRLVPSVTGARGEGGSGQSARVDGGTERKMPLNPLK